MPGIPAFLFVLPAAICAAPFVIPAMHMKENHLPYSIGRILDELEKYPGVLVEITGGEPLQQKGVYPLFEQLLAAGRSILLETNGSISLENVPEDVVKIMDMKCPGSGMHEKMNFDNFDFMDPKDEIKFVISSREDYSWAAQLVSSYDLHKRSTVTFSPVISRLPPDKLAGWILDDRLPVRLQAPASHHYLARQDKRLLNISNVYLGISRIIH